jgi:hypothetical protein
VFVNNIPTANFSHNQWFSFSLAIECGQKNLLTKALNKLAKVLWIEEEEWAIKQRVLNLPR